MRRSIRAVICFIGAWMAGIATSAAAVPATFQVLKNVPYIVGGDPAQKLDLYLPQNPGLSRLPLVVWIHGGGWAAGSKFPMPFPSIVSHGYAVASVEYRFSKVALFPAQIEDCQAAIRWLRAHADKYHINPDHIGVAGDSAGGHLVLLVGMSGGKNAFPKIGGNEQQSDRVQAVCDFFGPVDFNSVVQQFAHGDPPSVFHFNGSDPYSRLIGATIGTDKAKDAAVSPITYVSPGVPPVLILHGTHDALVPFAQSQELLAALQRVHDDALLQPFPGWGHGGRAFHSAAVQNLMLRFFDKHLMGKDVAVQLLPDSDVTAPGATTRP